MDIKNITFTNLSQLAGSDFAALISSDPFFDYVEGQRGATPSGMRYSCIMQEAGYQPISIKVDNSTFPAITQDEIEAAKPQLLMVSFSDFLAKFYTDRATNKPQISCKAGAIYSVGCAELVINVNQTTTVSKEDKKNEVSKS